MGRFPVDFAWDGFSTEYWQNAFADKAVNDSMITSLQLAALSMVISTLIGTLMAMALVRHQFFGRRATNLLIILPMATPEIVIGAALLSLSSPTSSASASRACSSPT
jgi:spermidine/putrescine transport system permease protein